MCRCSGVVGVLRAGLRVLVLKGLCLLRVGRLLLSMCCENKHSLSLRKYHNKGTESYEMQRANTEAAHTKNKTGNSIK